MKEALVGAVAIGRNEGPRLRRCLESLREQAEAVVYVDSWSTDDSLEIARTLGIETVRLDPAQPFSAARARNEGFRRLRELRPDVRFVQFVDGDCELRQGWIERGLRELRERPRAGVVCGRRRERHPEASIFNRLCDIEWDTPIGEARACGGDALMRVEAVEQVGGYDPAVIAAEDDELCFRLRRAGWTVHRVDAEMTVHDAAMFRVRQWWRRAKRCGWAYAQGAAMHGRSPERHFVRECRSVACWGLGLPALALLAAWPTGGWSLFLLALYPAQVARVRWSIRRRRGMRHAAFAYAASCVASKFPEAMGLASFLLHRWRGRTGRIIEYK